MFIRNAGVYKFEEKDKVRSMRSAAGTMDFRPNDFMESRSKKKDQ